MATPDSTEGEEEGESQPPSYEALRSARQYANLSRDAKRLCWILNGSLTTSISVMKETWYDPDSAPVAYFQETPDGTSWHPVSQSPLTEPKVSSITVRVDALEDWEDQWFEMHIRHVEDLEPSESINGNDSIQFGPLPDLNTDSDESGPEDEHLLRCCGSQRPRKKKAALVVKATKDFVTVHDYVSALHPWLMVRREDILRAMGDLLDDVPLPAETKLMVFHGVPDSIMILEEKDWSRMEQKPRSDLLEMPTTFTVVL